MITEPLPFINADKIPPYFDSPPNPASEIDPSIFNKVPAHFHEQDKIDEKNIIPDNRVYRALPAIGLEGERAIVENSSGIIKFYRYVKGIWREIGASILSAKGELLTRTSSSEAALTVGSNTQILIADSLQTKGIKWGYGAITYDTVGTELTVNSTTTETDLYSKTITGNDMGAAGGLYFRFTGVLTNNHAANGIVYRVKFGGTTIVSFDSTVNITASANARIFDLEVWCVNSTANAQQWGGKITFYGAGSQGTLYDVTSTTQRNYIGAIRNNSLVDTTSNQIFSLTHQASSTSVNLQTTRELAYLLKF